MLNERDVNATIICCDQGWNEEAGGVALTMSVVEELEDECDGGVCELAENALRLHLDRQIVVLSLLCNLPVDSVPLCRDLCTQLSEETFNHRW